MPYTTGRCIEHVWRDLVPLLTALAAATLLYGWRERQRKRTEVRPAYPDVQIAEVWKWWLEGVRYPADRALELTGSEGVPEALHATTLAGLTETERRCLGSEHPRLALRQAILEAATLALHLQALLEAGEPERKALLKGYEPGMEPWLREAAALAEVQCILLRQYAHWRYDDTAEDDWFHLFYRVARPYIREKVRLAQAYLLQADAGSLRVVEIYDQLLQELTQKSVKAAPKRRFARPDLR